MENIIAEEESDQHTNDEMDSTDNVGSRSSLSSIPVSPTVSSHHRRVSSPALSHVSLPEDVLDSPLPTLPHSSIRDSPVLRHRNLSFSLESSTQLSTDDNVVDLKKPAPTNNMATTKSKVVMDEETLQKEVRDILSGRQVQQQIRASICGAPGDMDLMATIRVGRKRSVFVKNIPFFRKFQESDEPEARHLKPFEIYKFADIWDMLLMIIGSLAAIGVGLCYPIMLVVDKQLFNTLIQADNLNSSTTFNSSKACATVVDSTNNTVSPITALKTIVNYYIILGFANILLSWVASATWIIAAERQVQRIRFALFRNILRQEIGWFDVNKSGELSSRLVSDLDKIKDGMREKVPDFIQLFVQMFSSLIYALVQGWKLTLVYLSVSPLIILTFNMTIKMIVRYTVKEVQAFASASAIAQEVLQNIRTVTAFQGQQKEEQRFTKSLLEAASIGIKKDTYVGICQGLSSIVNYSAAALSLWYGVQLTRTECSTYAAGTTLVVIFACMGVAGGISQLIPNVQNFAEAVGSGVFVFDIIEREPDIDASSDHGYIPQTITGDLEFENVTFTYPARQEAPILKRLSLKIPAGKTIALVGPSGCGKSTAIQLIQRFYDPSNGRVLLDGRNLTTLNVAWIRSHIGIVSQEPVLFRGSIEDNIRLGKLDASDDEVQAAAKMANAHDFIMALPESYKTSSGDKLSGGQKQRVAIARALISNPKILLLDEATSALDNTSERIVQEALDKAKAGRTTIVIAHRLSTIRNADLIIGIENGEVKESGSHDELMKQKGLYYELVTAQSQQEKEKEKNIESDSETDQNDEEMAYVWAQQVLANRRISKYSMASAGNSDGYGENADDLSLDGLTKDNRCCRVPFLYQIAKFNLPEWYWVLLGTFVSVAFGATQPFYGLIFANFYGAMAEPDPQEQDRLIRNYAIICFFIGVIRGIAQFLTGLSFAKSGEALTMRMRKLAFSAMLRQEMTYFDYETNSVGALVTRLSSDASALKGMTGTRVGTVLQGLSTAVTGLLISLFISWRLTLVTLSFTPVILIIMKLRSQMNDKNDKLKGNGSFVEQGGQYATQAIEHIRTVVALHRETHFINLYEDAFKQEFRKQTCQGYLLALGDAISTSLPHFIQCASFGYGIRLIEDGVIQFDQIYQVFSVIILTMYSATRSLTVVPDYSKAKIAALRIIKLHERQSQINPHAESGIILKDVIGHIEFRDVHFRYPSRPNLRVLRHFSLKCSNDHTTALVGSSGCGKSTTIALLQRLYDPLKGRILLDGHDIKVLNIRWLRSLIGLVQQEPVLFNLSVRDNIAYGDNSREVTRDEIECVARMANIHELIISLPQGYDTICGAKGSQLSGGQKQRIAIARALLRNPKLLLLDEATSALDNKSEKVVQSTLDKARIGRTCLTIAHRLSTIRNCEKIAVVNRGKVIEEGTHEELLKERGTYAKLALAQRRSIGGH